MRDQIGKALMAFSATIVTVTLVGATVGAFTASEKQTIQALRARIVALEQADIAQDARIVTLETASSSQATQIEALADAVADLDTRVGTLEDAVPPFTFSNMTATPSATCSASSCYVDISWNVEPCATGQVEWGLTTDYGNLSTLEDELLCFHRQRISGLAPGTRYNYRVIATDGIPGGQVAYHVIAA